MKESNLLAEFTLVGMSKKVQDLNYISQKNSKKRDKKRDKKMNQKMNKKRTKKKNKKKNKKRTKNETKNLYLPFSWGHFE